MIAPTTGTRITSGPHGLAGVNRFASYENAYGPQEEKVVDQADQLAENECSKAR